MSVYDCSISISLSKLLAIDIVPRSCMEANAEAEPALVLSPCFIITVELTAYTGGW